MNRNKVRRLFCRECEYELDRIVHNHQIDVDWAMTPISLQCGSCSFEVYATCPPFTFRQLESSAIRLGARTYLLHNRPMGGYIPF